MSEDPKAKLEAAAEATINPAFGMAVTAATAAQEADDTTVVCPCCGKNTLSKPVEIKGVLLDHYIACMLSGVPFWHEYPLYNGVIKISISRYSSALSDIIRTCLHISDMLASDKYADLRERWTECAAKLRCYAAATKITIKTGATVQLYEPADVVMRISDEIGFVYKALLTAGDTEQITSWINSIYTAITNKQVVSAIPMETLTTVIETHGYLYSVLAEAGFDKNFWEGIEFA